MTSHLILRPRLDCMFKKGPVPDGPEDTGNLPLIRLPWLDFCNQLQQEIVRQWTDKGGNMEMKTRVLPLWQINSDLVAKALEEYTYVYVPHKCHSHDFANLPMGRVRYYMQTVFPNRFTLDARGWGAAIDDILPAHGDCESGVFEQQYFRVVENVSKFDQPPRNDGWNLGSNYLLFICQLPHDEVIWRFSDVSVEAALAATIDYAKQTGQYLVVKGHPVNPGSMQPLINQVVEAKNEGVGIVYVLDEVSIHDAIAGAKSVICVNSGTGIEAMLHRKPIFTFGRSEYQSVVNRIDFDNMDRLLAMNYADIQGYRAWYDAYFKRTYDVRDAMSFRKAVL